MQLNISKTKTTKGGIKPLQSNSHKTTINNTIFNIVTKGLYIRPIDAIVREISTNALDGHIAKGNADQPFEITLPTEITPYFQVRDFGCSMSNETVFDVYAVLGESTKNTTSDSIGGWGVGGKSPAAYTDTFFITTFKDGIRRVYQSSCLADSVPLELLLEGKTEEPDGVQVKVPVKKEDFNKFVNAVKSQLSPFEVKPIIVNSGYFNEDFVYDFDLTTADKIEIKPTLVIPDANGELYKQKITTNVYTGCTPYSSLSIRMGCVVYPINVTSDFYINNQKRIETIKKLSGIDSFMLDLPVDAVDIKPSREDLDYSERTTDVLSQMISTLTKQYKKEILSIVFAARNLPILEAVNYIKNNASNENVIKYIANNYKIKSYLNNKKIFYNQIPNNFKLCLYEDLQYLEITTGISSNFTVTNGDESKKINKSDYNYHFNSEMVLNIVLKSTGFIKKIDYALSNNLLKKSGLYTRSTIQKYAYSNTRSEIKEGLFFGKETLRSQLVLSQEQIDVYLPVFKKFYKEVNVVELPEIPKEVKTYYSSTTSASIPEIYLTVFTEKGKTQGDVVSKPYTFKTVNSIKDSFTCFSTPVYFFVKNKRHDFYNPRAIKQLCELSNINVVCLSVPESLLNKILDKPSLNFYREEKLIDDLTSKLSLDLIETIKDQYSKHIFYEEFFDYNYRESCLSRYLLKKDFFSYVRKPFFKFVPKLTNEDFIFSFIAKQFLKESEINKIKEEAIKYRQRAIKRIEIISKHKPTLKLITSSSDPETVLQLIKLNFKDFTYE
jgi:hypothetical protein